MNDDGTAMHDGVASGFRVVGAGEDALRRSEERLKLLADAGRLLSSALDYEATLADVCRLVVPRFADWCLLDLVSEDGQLQRLEVAHRDPARVELAREVQRRYPPRPDRPSGLLNVLQTGEPEVAYEISDAQLEKSAQDAEHYRLMLELELRSAMILPLKARGRTIGALSLIAAESGRRYEDADLPVALELASRIALAVDNARLFAEAREAVRRREEALQLHWQIEHQLRLLVEASASLSASLDMDAVAGAVLALSRQLVAADAYAVWRYQPASGRWGIALSSGLSEEYRHSTVENLERTPQLPPHPVVAEDIAAIPLLEDRRAALEREGIRSMMIVPLSVRGEQSGTLVFYYRERHVFSEAEVPVATAMANLAGSAIGSAELFDEVRAAGNRKDEFLAMLSHELRNPLAAISNAALVMKMAPGPMPEACVWGVDLIDRQVHHLVRLIDDLLDVSRITRGKIELRRSAIDAANVVDASIESVRRFIDERGHRLEVDCDAGLIVDADPTRLEQIIVNLLTNASKYTEPGGEIRVAAHRDHDTGEVVIRVRDTGIGIPPDQLPRMFEIFEQGERSLERAEGGLGLGLTLVRRLTEMHGGSVLAHSVGCGHGSEFIVRLPAIPADRVDG